MKSAGRQTAEGILEIQVVAAGSLNDARLDEIVRLCSDTFDQDEDFELVLANLPGTVHLLARLDGEIW